MTDKPTLPGKVWRLWTDFHTREDAERYQPWSGGWHIDIIPAPETCDWREDEDGNYDGSCGLKWIVVWGGPESDPEGCIESQSEDYNYCVKCGRKLVVHKYTEPGDDDADA